MASEDSSSGSILSVETAGTYSQNSVDPIEENPDAANLNRNAATQTHSDDSPPSTQTTEGNRDAANPDQNEANQTDSDDPPFALKSAALLMEKGSKAFQARDFNLFKRVLKTFNGAEFADQFVPEKFKYGLALEPQFRIENDVMIEALPMEADYQLYGTTIVAIQVPRDDDLESAGLHLVDVLGKVSLKMVEMQPGDSVEKVDLLSALGEVELKKGSYVDSCKHYQEALSILEGVVEPDNQRIAHLYPFIADLPSLKAPRNFKICFCLANCYKIEEAIEYCQKAILVCKNRIQRLNSSSGLANVNQEPFSSVPDVGPSLPKKDDDAQLELLLREFEKKLLILKQCLKTSSSTTKSYESINTRMQKESGIETSGTKGQLSPDPASKEPMSSTSNQPGGPERSPPTAGKGAKRQLFPDPPNNESTSTKKQSLDQSAEEDKE
ncbi:uncharacterized protein LOC132277783 [Cornus florida]|uniref:uncharacterized protein LOC132277783 n=1 Tax=Cornus florida TaxID=4283 RepID=UPI00289F5889|nr:uncharacterized protein LOC132277783 [Cornus florida]